MTTLLMGSERDGSETLQMPTHAPASRVPAGADQVAVADTEMMPATFPAPARFESAPPSMPPPMKPQRGFPALPAMTAGLISTAAMWLGLALFVIAAAYPLTDFGRASLTLIGSFLIAIVVAFALSSRREYA